MTHSPEVQAILDDIRHKAILEKMRHDAVLAALTDEQRTAVAKWLFDRGNVLMRQATSEERDGNLTFCVMDQGGACALGSAAYALRCKKPYDGLMED